MKKLARSRIACLKGIPCAVCASSDGACVLIRDWTLAVDGIISNHDVCVLFGERNSLDSPVSYACAFHLVCFQVEATGRMPGSKGRAARNSAAAYAGARRSEVIVGWCSCGRCLRWDMASSVLIFCRRLWDGTRCLTGM